MPNFTDPFPGINKTDSLIVNDLIKVLKLDLASELDATELYRTHAAATNNILAREVLLDIAKEEVKHSGEFLKLIQILDPEELTLIESGAAEVENFKSFAEGWRK